MERSVALTLDYKEIKSTLDIEVTVYPNAPSIALAKKSNRYNAIWDTGAIVSVISRKVAEDLELELSDSREIAGAVYGLEIIQTSEIILDIPDCITVHNLLVNVMNIPTDLNIDVLIGMDIISKGDFAVTNKDNKTVLSFSVPSTRKIDFKEENDVLLGRELNRLRLKNIEKKQE